MGQVSLSWYELAELTAEAEALFAELVGEEKEEAIFNYIGNYINNH